jgi:hypothetical protein
MSNTRFLNDKTQINLCPENQENQYILSKFHFFPISLKSLTLFSYCCVIQQSFTLALECLQPLSNLETEPRKMIFMR